ncbi:DUF3800 domain-containing protein [Cryobacterium sp. N19]|uniref:DUF3800 domain-containing protein n=1 Tax=Cryobacterium sp. N19 TaxID=2048288 RepID=UPI0018EC8BC4|nr:DUF3800 domain-containing protein [Cryobacterium sp. N19]
MSTSELESMPIEIYCDESRPELFVSEFPPAANTLIGSLWILGAQRDAFKTAIGALREEYGVWGEIKWTKVSPAKIDFYRALVDLFLTSPGMRFRCIVIDTVRLDMRRFHNSDSELGFYKFYYQMLTHWIDDGLSYRIFCDDKVNRDRTRLQTLGRVLQNGHPASRVEHVQAVQSTESVMIQTCDLLLGMAQAVFNESNRGSEAKRSLIAHLESGLGRPIAPTWQTERKFNIFKISLQGDSQ